MGYWLLAKRRIDRSGASWSPSSGCRGSFRLRRRLVVVFWWAARRRLLRSAFFWPARRFVWLGARPLCWFGARGSFCLRRGVRLGWADAPRATLSRSGCRRRRACLWSTRRTMVCRERVCSIWAWIFVCFSRLRSALPLCALVWAFWVRWVFRFFSFSAFLVWPRVLFEQKMIRLQLVSLGLK